MNQKRKNYVYYVFILKEYLREIFRHHYPTEIIRLIIMSTYTFNKIICGSLCTILINKKIYFWGCADSSNFKLFEYNYSQESVSCKGTNVKSISHEIYKNIR